eukprot:3678846-Prorocentrum_lima.AAC.1
MKTFEERVRKSCAGGHSYWTNGLLAMHTPSEQALMFRHFRPIWTWSAKNSSDPSLCVPKR